MDEIIIPDEFNYIALFLSFSCGYRCSYCINHHGGDLVKPKIMFKDDWIKAINRIKTRPDLPITIQGGEPSTHPDMIEIIHGIRKDIPIDILTNLDRPLSYWMQLDPLRLKRKSPYASIRVSYHHGQSDFDVLCNKVIKLKDIGYHIGIWEVDHPNYHGEVIFRQQKAHSLGIDYRLKEFLGPYKGKVYGTMRYPDAVNSKFIRDCMCRTTELLISPSGYIHRCHSDLYADRCRVGHILDDKPSKWRLGKFSFCNVYGKCNSCDVKVKTNRFQEYGHSSVEIKDISKEFSDNHGYIEEVVNTYGKHK